jgi:glycosyltransferase involved in cell wall biosynthesis
MTNQKVIFWINDTDQILRGEKPAYGIGGANVQMAFWANTFYNQGYKVYALTRSFKNNGAIIHGVQYIWHPVIRYIGKFVNYFTMLTLLFIIRPNLVFTRAKVGQLAFLSFLSKLFNFKLVHMLASDDDVLVINKIGKTKFQKAIDKIDYIIAQNQIQKDNYNQSFKKVNIPIIPNIWNEKIGTSNLNKSYYDFIWVANIGDNKRPLWFVNLAAQLPQFKFGLVGSPFNQSLFNECKSKAAQLTNIEILGYKSLFEVNELVGSSKVLVCTSIIEGFPNTFLQALSVNVPLLSTVDPSDIIKNHQIGSTVEHEEELALKALELMENKEMYDNCKTNIISYFSNTHSPEMNYQIIKKYIGV